MVASPDGLVLDTSDVDHPCELLEIKYPGCGKPISLIRLCTKTKHKPLPFFLQYKDREFHLKRISIIKYNGKYMYVRIYITARSWCDFIV